MASDLDKRYARWVNWGLKGQVEFLSWPDVSPQKTQAEILHDLNEVDKDILFQDFISCLFKPSKSQRRRASQEAE